MTAFRLLWTAADHRTRRDLLLAAVLAGTAELCAAGLPGVSGWFLTSCAVVTAQANTTWSWMYPSRTVRALALGRTGLRYSERLVSQWRPARRDRLASLTAGPCRDHGPGTASCATTVTAP